MHDQQERTGIADFLSRDSRQVWAVDRTTGESHYLPIGSADELRQIARAQWRCPVPGCTVEITTRGGAKRDHFYHLGPVPHASDPESEAHLGAKMMLLDWARSVVPNHIATAAEASVPVGPRRRIADVLVGNEKARWALEVEYKGPAVAEVRAKSADYRTAGVGVAWFIGHTSLKLAADRTVRVSEVARQLALTSGFVFAVNPQYRVIGVLCGDADGTSRINQWTQLAHLHVDPLDQCSFDPLLGVVTPTTRRIVEHEEQRRREEEAEQRRRLQREARWRAFVEHRDRSIAEATEVWRNSELRQTLTRRNGEFPRLLALGGTDKDIWAPPEYWHAVIYECLIHRQTIRFGMPDVRRALAQHRIRHTPSARRLFIAVFEFLELLRTHHVVRIERSANGAFRSARGLTAAEQQQDRLTRRNTRVATPASLTADERRERDLERAKRRSQRAAAKGAKRAREDAARAAKKDEDLLRTQRHEAQWNRSSIRQQLLDSCGSVPEFIIWKALTKSERTIDALPALWHAVIYLSCIAEPSEHGTVTVEDARKALVANHITWHGTSQQLDDAISGYLTNLRQRRILK